MEVQNEGKTGLEMAVIPLDRTGGILYNSRQKGTSFLVRVTDECWPDDLFQDLRRENVRAAVRPASWFRRLKGR